MAPSWVFAVLLMEGSGNRLRQAGALRRRQARFVLLGDLADGSLCSLNGHFRWRLGYRRPLVEGTAP